MRNLWKKLIESFDNGHSGFSARKLSAFVAVCTGVYITAKLLPAEDQIEALYAWLGFALLCLGIITVQQVIEFKNGKKNNDNGTS